MKDISELSYNELTELQKQIRELKVRKFKEENGRTKSMLGSAELHECMYNIIAKRFPKLVDGVYSEYQRMVDILYFHKIKTSILSICDAVTGNYSIAPNRNNKDKLNITMNGSYIKSDGADYDALYTQILELCIKYGEKANKGDR